MKFFSVYLFVLASFFGCQAEQNAEVATDPQIEVQAVEDTLRSFFEAISAYDYQSLSDLTSEDYVLIEDGPVWSLDSLTALMRQLEGQATIAYEFSDMETVVEGPMAWMTYKNNGVMTMGDQQQHFDWTESAVFRKTGDGWNIVLLHSTLNDPDTSDTGE